ncbi:hypothetical protein M2H12_20735 [Vibrio vulnificus]|nr:hypothetical protein [Vibrio vulnificus]EJN6713569.1 hypothetical protein [Vibrio vulnificus]MCU8168119.1 hypothetical protein [Vibrio vulnificus]MCU8172705.1 hypothetical protein [Vibrio vulnificus]MCU8269305.1 hypothetical protein [Vibrio vulnificus]
MRWIAIILGLIITTQTTAGVVVFSGSVVGTPCPIEIKNQKDHQIKIEHTHSQKKCVPSKTQTSPIYKKIDLSQNPPAETLLIGHRLTVQYY